MKTGLQKAQERFERWWLGKMVRDEICSRVPALSDTPFKRVVKIQTHGNSSFVSGVAVLTFEDGSTMNLPKGAYAYRPAKWELEVLDEKDGER